MNKLKFLIPVLLALVGVVFSIFEYRKKVEKENERADILKKAREAKAEKAAFNSLEKDNDPNSI